MERWERRREAKERNRTQVREREKQTIKHHYFPLPPPTPRPRPRSRLIPALLAGVDESGNRLLWRPQHLRSAETFVNLLPGSMTRSPALTWRQAHTALLIFTLISNCRLHMAGGGGREEGGHGRMKVACVYRDVTEGRRDCVTTVTSRLGARAREHECLGS